MFEEFIQTIKTDFKRWQDLKNELIVKNKYVGETLTSLKVLKDNLGETVDLSNIEKVVDAKHNELNDLCGQFEEHTKQINVIKKDTKEALRDILELYKMLCIEELKATTAATEAAKVLYGKFDNLQLRWDPPINNIFKDEGRKPFDAPEPTASANDDLLYSASNL